jgi:hypothetical protein
MGDRDSPALSLRTAKNVMHLQELCQAVAVGCNRLASDRLDAAHLAKLVDQLQRLEFLAMGVQADLVELLQART